jgi:hypothetical protein
MIIVEDVFVVRYKAADNTYAEGDGTPEGSRQLTPDEAIAYEYGIDIDDAIGAIETLPNEEIHWSRKVTHVDG